MPLENISAASSSSLFANTESAIRSVAVVPAFKMFLAFTEPWWERYGFTTGRMTTTLPFRKLYYWSIEKDFDNATGIVNLNNNSAVLAGYEDDYSSHYWADMLREHQNLEPVYFSNAVPHMQYHHKTLDLFGDDMRAVAARSLMAQVRLVHNDSSIPDPYAFIFMDCEFLWEVWLFI